MEQNSEVPPMGAENLPLKEMKAEQTAEEIEASKLKKSKQFKILAGLAVVIAVFGGIMIGLMIRQKNGHQLVPSPSPILPSPSPELVPSETPYNLKQKIEQFQSKMEQLDLEESALNPPALDYNIRFKVEE